MLVIIFPAAFNRGFQVNASSTFLSPKAILRVAAILSIWSVKAKDCLGIVAQ